MKTKMIITALFAALSFTSCVNLMSKQNVPQQVKHLDNEKVIKQSFALKDFDLYGWISLMSQLIIINRALYVNKQQEGKICAIT